MLRILICLGALALTSCGVSTACQLSTRGCDCYKGLPNSVTCSEANNPGTICCAMTTFPESGNCECHTTKPTCYQSDTSDYCYCGVGTTGVKSTHTQVSTCSPNAPEVCCLDTSDNWGGCDCNSQTSCTGKLKQVPQCPVEVTSCGSTKSRVASCSQ
jgi:hypothetical protein